MREQKSSKSSLYRLSWKNAHEFAGVYDAFSEKLWRHIYLRVSRREEANDLVAEVFLKTWEYLKTGKDIDNIQAFLFRTAHNSVVDWYRRRTKIAELDSSLEQGEYDDLIVQTDPSPEIISSVSARNHVKKILTQIPDKDRKLLVMRFIDELEIKEIAKILGKTKSAVSVGLHRALKAFEKISQANEAKK
jgi:RNA polymerase sigma-70 factor (ECF subfamily)